MEAGGAIAEVGPLPLRQDASTRTKEDIDSIRHVYLDLDHGAREDLESAENSSAVQRVRTFQTIRPFTLHS